MSKLPLPDPQKIPLEYLLDPTMSSQNIIGEYQLARLNRATNIEREIRRLVKAYLDEMTGAGLAIFLRENRERILEFCSSVKTDPQ